MRLGLILGALMWCVILFFSTGCMKKIALWPPVVEFYPGVDLGVGVNGISQVDNKRTMQESK